MNLKEIKQKGKECRNLKDALELELSYDTSNGTPTSVQNYFRKLKSDFVIAAFKQCVLDHSMLKFYNYSMQGYCQVLYDRDYETRVHESIDKLADLLCVPVSIRNRKDEVVINIRYWG